MKIIKACWIIYFLYYFYLTWTGLRGLLSSNVNTLADWRGGVEVVLLLLATFSFTFGLKILPRFLWQNILYLLIGVWVLDLAFAFSFFSHFPELNIWFVQGGYSGGMQELIHQDLYAIGVSLPALFAVFRLGYKPNLGL